VTGARGGGLVKTRGGAAGGGGSQRGRECKELGGRSIDSGNRTMGTGQGICCMKGAK